MEPCQRNAKRQSKWVRENLRKRCRSYAAKLCLALPFLDKLWV